MEQAIHSRELTLLMLIRKFCKKLDCLQMEAPFWWRRKLKKEYNCYLSSLKDRTFTNTLNLLRIASDLMGTFASTSIPTPLMTCKSYKSKGTISTMLRNTTSICWKVLWQFWTTNSNRAWANLLSLQKWGQQLQTLTSTGASPSSVCTTEELALPLHQKTVRWSSLLRKRLA